MRATRLVTWLTAAVAATVILVAKPAHIVHLGFAVLPGCPGWLFFVEELIAHPEHEREANLSARIKLIKDVSQFLTSRHISLVFVPVPDKARVEAKRLCSLRRSALDDRWSRIIGRLQQAGIKVVDLLPALQSLDGNAFYRTDAHWNQSGARRAAETVAAHLRDWGLASAQRAEFRVLIKPPTERPRGDLSRYIDRLGVPGALHPSEEMEAEEDIQQSAPAGVGLLDEVPRPDTVLIGTSFSITSHFAGFLALALGAPVDNRGKGAGGLTGAMRAYMADPTFTEAPPHVIIWEIPEHYMDDPLPAAERIWAQNLLT